MSALDSLRANARIVNLLTGWRWQIVELAREEGATWEEIGQALGVTRQSAHAAYAEAIAGQERFNAEYDFIRFDVDRARAVLDDSDPV